MQAYNPERGCGTLVAGGFYAQGGMSDDGVLAPWTFVLGDGTEGGENLYVALPARQMTIARLPETLQTGRLVTPEGDAIPTDQLLPALRKLPKFALFDHIGANNYSAYSFAAEAARHGVSRRIPREIAEQVAKLAPLPIVFSHSIMPTIAAAERDSFIVWARTVLADSDLLADLDTLLLRAHGDIEPALPLAQIAEGLVKLFQTGRTYADPSWGIRKVGNKQPYNGGLHWSVSVLAALAAIKAGRDEQQLYKLLPAWLTDHITVAEQLVGMAWITHASYMKAGDENDAELKAIDDDGIVIFDL